MSLASFFLWHLSEVQRRLRAFMAESSRRRLVREREAQTARWYHDLERDR